MAKGGALEKIPVHLTEQNTQGRWPTTITSSRGGVSLR